MYYISIQPTDSALITCSSDLIYYCRNCGHEDNTIAVDDITVLKTQLKRSKQDFGYIINKYTKLDPSLPRVNNIKCPNYSCKTNEHHDDMDDNDIEREIITIRYDDINLKYVYLCCDCDTVWKTEDKS